jgi:tRNA A-37 threonylcarbamoyl transferase component Bud32
VPHCYGWYDFASDRQDDATVLARRHPNMSLIWEDNLPPRALLLEYIEDTVPLSAENYTPQMAPAVVNALDRIHSVGILHEDPQTRNILVRPDGKTIWVELYYS